MKHPTREPWQWSESEWSVRVNRVRAGKPFRPSVWPRQAKCAVAISFDSDHETNELRDGGESIGRLSWGEYGSRVGIPRIEALLAAHDVKATFFVPAVAAFLHPEEQRRLVATGHEIGIHGWIHELNSVLPYETERDLLFRAADALEKVSGKRPVGIRTPSWDFSQDTLRIIKELGLSYDSSLMADEDCYELLLEGGATGIVEVPVEWIRNDAAYFMMNRANGLRPYAQPSAVLDVFLREFDAAWEAGGLFQLTLHPHVIAYRSRIWILERILQHARDRGSVWFATHAEVAQYVSGDTPEVHEPAVILS